MKWLVVNALATLALVSGCGSPDPSVLDNPAADASADAQLDVADAAVTDGAEDRALPPDAMTTDVGVGPDASSTDVAVTDVAVTDVAMPDVSATDAATLVDVPRADVASDAGVADAPRPDAGSGCTAAAPSVVVAAPGAGEMIETCTAAGVPVYYDFRANVTAPAGVASVTARWITPDGAEAAPSATAVAAPYVFRRQVGGPATSVPALAVFGIRGTWRFEVTATDACARRTVGTQEFTLIFTTRRCPNP